jgi:ATP-binding cassette, subfamily B, bacterial PglK
MYKISKSILFSIYSYNKFKTLSLVIMLILGTFIEGLSIAIIFPVLELLINNENNNIFYKLIPYFDNNRDKVLFNSILIISVIFFIKSVFLVAFSWWRTGYHKKLNEHFRVKILKKYILNDYLFFVKNKASILLRNSYNEISFFVQAVDTLLKLIAEIFVFLIIFIILAYFQPKFTLTILAIFFIFSCTYFLFIKKKLSFWSEGKIKYSGKIIQILQQSFDSIKFIKIKNLENKILKDYEDKVINFAKFNRYQYFITEMPRIFLEVLGVGCLLFLLFILYNENKSDLSYLVPSLGLFAVSAFRILPSVNRIINGAQGILNASASIKVIFDSFSTENTRIQNHKFKNFNFQKKIEIKNLSFKYPKNENNVLQNINLEIKKNDFICIVGESGTGKTTLSDLILGLLKPSKGEILIDGQNLNDKNLKDWQKNVGYVPQNIILFNDTIKENITLANETEKIDSDMLDQVVESAQLAEMTSNKKDNLDFIIDEKGKNLSAGQIQRVAIARALFSKPEILIFDEFTSSLDQKTQGKILDVINKISKNKTIILISHTKDVISMASKIIQIEKSGDIKVINK